MKLTEEQIKKMFEAWATTEDRHDGVFGNNNNFTRDEWVAEKSFKAAIELLLPIIQKQDEAISFYADKNSWNGRRLQPGFSYTPKYMSIGINDDAYLFEATMEARGFGGEWYEGAMYVGGKLAHQTQKEVSEYLSKIGVEGC